MTPQCELAGFINDKSNPTSECAGVLPSSCACVSTTGRHTDQDALQTQAMIGATTFNDELLAEFFNDILHENQLHVPEQTMITTNSVPWAALFSASAEIQLIISNPGMYAFARQGLQFPDAG